MLLTCATSRFADDVLHGTRPFLQTLLELTNQPRPPADLLMGQRAPSVAQIAVAVAFAFSCFGLLLFLWNAFGGPVPFAPEGYRVKVPFNEATQLAVESDVRISNVSVGRVKKIELEDEGENRDLADRRRSRSTTATRRSPRTRWRSCARRRCWARPTSS